MHKQQISSSILFEVYKSLFDNNHDACFAVDLEGNFILFNDAATQITGYSKEEALRMTFIPLIHESYLEQILIHFNIGKQGISENFEMIIRHKSGKRVDLYVTSVPIIIDSKVYGLIGIGKVITEKKIQETLLSGQNKVLEMIAKGEAFEDVLTNIVQLIEKVTDGALCSILLVDKENKFLINGASPNLPLEYAESIARIRIGPNVGSCGTAVHFKQQIVVSDIETDPRWARYKEIPLKCNLKACWSSPVYDNQQNVLGTFAMYYHKIHTPTEVDFNIIEKATYLTSLAIQHYHAEDKINFMAFHDVLTGLPNRRLLNKTISNTIELHSNQSIAIMYIDLDRFKLINDSLGHYIGDRLLVNVAKRLLGCIGEQDIVSRQGGDEFTVLLLNRTKQEIRSIAETIITLLAKSFIVEGYELFVTPSIGISCYPDDGVGATELFRKADVAMYQVKKEGRNNYRFYDLTLEKETYDKFELENDLRKALEKNEFHLLYQPIMDLTNHRVLGVEALIRWAHPIRGTISPDQFIPVAEETGIIIALGEWVVRSACQQLKVWEDNGLTSMAVSINISIRQFYQPNFVSMVAKVIKETNINPSNLTIEITESMTMDVEVATMILYKLKSLGVNISIDDFGTGYSSLSYLKKFPIDHLKIDKSFIRDIAKSKNDENIATTILIMAHNLGLNVIAEGVETNEQLEILKQHRCNAAQGYLFSKPISVEEVIHFNSYIEK